MDRANLKVSHATADRLRLAKVIMSASIGQPLSTGQAIDYLLAHWQLTRTQNHLIIVGADGVPRPAVDVPA